MVCKKCGAEIKAGNKFCAKCGIPIEKAKEVVSEVGRTQDSSQRDEERKTVPAGQSDGRKLPLVPIAVGVVALLLAIGVGSFFLFRGRDDSESADAATGDKTTISDNTETVTAENTENPVTDWREMTPLYTIEDVPSVNIHAQNYAAAAKAPGIAWDNSLFYWLEDVDQTSTEDGYLAKCPITKMLLRNAESGNLIQYEIYRDPNTSEIYKIVSIEQVGENLQLVDYYYQGGVPNFTFSRSDSVYTPTYATPAKVGERYYFNGDVLARWRMIREPNEIGEYVLAPTGANYSQADYYAESAELQAIYDGVELRELNAARNTFDAVTAAGNGIGLVKGRVTDTVGNPVAGVTVDILRAEDGVLLYRAVTGEDGSFSIFVYLEDVECSIVIRGDGTYDSNSIQGVMLARSNGGTFYGNLLMHRLDGDEYPVHINVYSAADVRTGEDGSLLRDLLQGAEVSLRAGAGAHTGEVLQTFKADENGYLNTALSSGTYTAQVDVPGYATAYLTIEVMEQETTAEGYVLPALAADQAGIVMTWEGSADLDLTLFTPYQSTNGDMAHIGGRITEDGYGNRLAADNAAGCEVMYVNTAVLGNYKLYVNNYSESEAGNYNSSQLSTLNIHIYIYDSNGLLAEYSFPAGQIGVVWEVADLNGGQVTPSQRVYVSLEGKSWWIDSKWVLDLEKCPNLTSILENITLIAIDCFSDSDVEKTINELLDGNQAKVSLVLGEQYYSVPCLLRMANVENDEGGISYTSDQVRSIMYSLTGKQLELVWLSGEEKLYTHQGTGGVGGWFSLSIDMTQAGATGNITGSYVDGQGFVWKIPFEVYHYEGYKMSDVIFTVTRNPDSCFDGYSIIGVEVIPTDNSGWVQAYNDYLVRVYGSEIEGVFDLIYLDDDGIPEIYVTGPDWATGDNLLYYREGRIESIHFCNDGGSYIKGSGLICDSGGKMGGYYDTVYQLINGDMNVIGDGQYYILDEYYFEEDWEDWMFVFSWYGETVTAEQYSAYFNSVFDSSKATRCYGSYWYGSQNIDQFLNTLQQFINY